MNGLNVDVGIESASSLGCYLAGRCYDVTPERDLSTEWLTMALLCLISFFLKRNCLFRFERSMVSRSRRVMWPKPVKTIFFTVTYYIIITECNIKIYPSKTHKVRILFLLLQPVELSSQTTSHKTRDPRWLVHE